MALFVPVGWSRSAPVYEPRHSHVGVMGGKIKEMTVKNGSSCVPGMGTLSLAPSLINSISLVRSFNLIVSISTKERG